MKELCLAQARDQNADVFYQVAGGSGTGLFEACVETGTWPSALTPTSTLTTRILRIRSWLT